MKKKTKETVIIGVGLITLSLLLHYVHYLLFKDAHHTLIFLVADIAFIPMEVFFTTLIIDRLLEKREKSHFVEKVNMLIGVFFTDLGTSMLAELVKGDTNLSELINANICTKKWDDISCNELQGKLLKHDFKIDINKVDIDKVRNTLAINRDLITNLIMNENVHEHEGFTDALMSLLHLREEMETRCCHKLEAFELEHIAGDMADAYMNLSIEWCQYMNYLSKNYPKLFVKALINNPFDKRAQKEKDKLYLPQLNK
ncbi:MAG: hypothetical protein ACRC2K_04090 [Clostridium sp.]